MLCVLVSRVVTGTIYHLTDSKLPLRGDRTPRMIKMDTVTALAPKERNVPTMTTVLLTLLGIVIAQFLYQIIYYRHFHPLRHYPGPFWASVTRLWQAWHFYWGSELELETKAIRQYGTKVPTDLHGLVSRIHINRSNYPGFTYDAPHCR